MKPITESLLENSKSAIIGCVELHNKPIFNYRYEICTILAINGWELILKAFIVENHPDIKIIRKDGTTKPFEECVGFVSSQIGKPFRTIEENLNKIYEFRNHIIHFYKDHIGTILYSLLHKSVILYNSFLKENFNVDLSEQTNLMLLPIGFKPFASPVDFLSNNSELSKSSTSVQAFIKSIIKSTEMLDSEGIEDSILTEFNIAVINENRIKNADIIAGITKDKSASKLNVANIIRDREITNDESAKKIQIDEVTIFKTLYTLSYYDVVTKARSIFSDFMQGPKFNRVMKTIKDNPNFHKKRYLDIQNKTGQGKDYYTQEIFNELAKYYKIKEK